jgi:citrate lyase subunit beta-like protein
VRTHDNRELLYARQCTIAHAKAYGLQAIDIVNIHFKQPELLQAEARDGAYMGFTGKQVCTCVVRRTTSLATLGDH